MKNRYLFLIFFSVLGFSQKAITVNNSNNLSKLYSVAALNVYADSSQKKVEDFYSLLTIYSNKETSTELKNELEKSILLLFQNKNQLVLDLTSSENKTIEIFSFLNKISNKNYFFSLSNSEKIDSNKFGGWNLSFDISVKQNNQSKTISVLQKVYFDEQLKTFGSKSKWVRSIVLGNQN